jgi:CRP-like cAMP-binding protein/RsiW-degrading membrane proteinase PrsW (M82 family)
MFADVAAYAIAICIPALAAYLIFSLDLFGTGKASTLAMSFFWGALGATAGAYVLNAWFADRIGLLNTRTFSAPIIEELLKAGVLFYLIGRPRFRYFVDGALYGFAAGTGFAIVENLFYLLLLPEGQALSVMVKRTLSSSLMHAFASGLLGLGLGLMRRVGPRQKPAFLLGSIGLAMLIHLIFNNVVVRIADPDLTFWLAVFIGLGGSGLMALLLDYGLRLEKARFTASLGLAEGVSRAERRAVQQLGGQGLEHVLSDLALYFGEAKARQIRHLLIKQANIGILKNNLKGQAGPQLRRAWEAEIVRLRAEADALRQDLGLYAMSLLRSLLPGEEDSQWGMIQNKMADFAPHHCYKFDLFIMASKMAQGLSPEQLARTAALLGQSSFFAALPPSDLENLSRAISPRKLRPGDLLFQRHEPGDALYLVEAGQLEVFTQDQGGEELVLRVVGDYEVVGELALLDGQPRSASARALRDCQVWMLQRKHFVMFVESRPRAQLAILQYLAGRIRSTTDLILYDDQLAGEAVFEQVGDFLRSTLNLPDSLLRPAEDVL